MYAVVFGDGHTLVVPKGEARFWAWLSMEIVDLDVFKVNGSPIPLTPFDII